MRLSPSFARTVEECTLRARWLRIDQAPREVPPADEPLRYGTAAHAALETLLRAVKDEAATVDLASAPWQERASAAIDAALSEHGPFAPERAERLRDIVRQHAASLGPVRGRDVLGVEVPLRWKAGEDTPVVGFADRIDRVDGRTIRVVDYKTGRRGFPEDELRTSLQFRTYAVAATNRFRWARAVEVEVAQLDRHERTRARFDGEELAVIADELAARYLAADARVTGGPWEPTEGPWCGICEFTSLCPAKGGQPAEGTWDPRLGALVGAPPTLPGT